MKFHFKTVLFLLMLVALACQKETKKNIDFFVVKTEEVHIKGDTGNGITFSAKIILEDDLEILERGFVFGVGKDPDMENSEKIIASETEANSFSVDRNEFLVPNVTYMVKGYVRTKNYTTYGNVVSFYSTGSKGPTIQTILPDTAFWGDTIRITGQLFDPTGKHNTVYFNDYEAKIVDFKKDTLYAVVPSQLMTFESNIRVKTYDKQHVFTTPFRIYKPFITGISKTSGQHPDTLEITGKYFLKDHCSVSFGGGYPTPFYSSHESIKFVVPFLGEAQILKITLNQFNESFPVPQNYQYNRQAVLDVTPTEIYLGDELRVSTVNIDLEKLFLNVYFDNKIIRYQKGDDFFTFNPSPETDINKASYICRVLLGNKELYNQVVNHKNPEFSITNGDTFGYMATINMELQGFYGSIANLKFKKVNKNYEISKTLTITGTQAICSLPTAIVPGEYEIWLTQGERMTPPKRINVALPENLEIQNDSYARSESYHDINGIYLPKEGTYEVKHIESGRNFSIPISTGADGNTWKPTMMGDGLYEFGFTINSSQVKTDIKLDLRDYLFFHKKYTAKLLPSGNSLAFLYDNIIHTSNSRIDVNLGTESTNDQSLWLLGNTNSYPIFFRGKICVVNNGNLFWFNKTMGKWERDDYNFPPNQLATACVSDDKLYVFSRNYKIYVYDTGWEEGPSVGGADWSVSYPRYSFSHGDNIYFWSFYRLYRCSKSTWSINEVILPPHGEITATRIQHVFQYQGETYFCYMNNAQSTNLMMKFSPETKKFSFLTPGFIAAKASQCLFAPDEFGNIFMLNGGFIYKFLP